MRRPWTTLASKARALVHYAVERGMDGDRLLAVARLAPNVLERGDARVSSASVAALWSDLARSTGDPELGSGSASRRGAPARSAWSVSGR